MEYKATIIPAWEESASTYNRSKDSGFKAIQCPTQICEKCVMHLS